MRILWITLESILPANTGGRIGVFKRLEQLSRENEIYLYYPYDNESELTQVKELEKYCKKVYPYNRTKNRKNGILRLFKYPFTVGSREFHDMKRDIQQCLDNYAIDVINVDFPHMCVNLFNINTDIPIVLNEHNIEWRVYRTIAKSHKNIFKKVAYFIDSYRLKSYEEKVLKKISFSKITFVSSEDMRSMIESGMVSNEQAVLIPVGADVHEMENVPHDGLNIIFVGKMSYGPNIEAVSWFAKDIFPVIQEHLPKVKFFIVGKDPAEDVLKLKSPSIIITGIVDDLEKYYAIADLVVLPLRNGGGVKVKLLEAVGYKKPIVSTSVGVEGTYYSNHIIPVSDDAEGFANLCLECLCNFDKYNIEEAYKYFLDNYTWETVGDKYLNVLRNI